MAKKSVLVLMSGGIDSSTLAKHYIDRDWHVRGLYVDYHQPWSSEVIAAETIADYLGIALSRLKTAPLKPLEKNFVPVRNAHLLTIAVHLAYTWKIPNVGIGVNRGEFLDATPEFLDRFNFMLDYCFKEGNHPWVLAPFCNWSKERVVRYALKIGVPLELTKTCMSSPPCGRCLGCKLRRKYGISESTYVSRRFHTG